MQKRRIASKERDYQIHDDIDPTVEFFYRPRNITVLVIFIASLVYIALFKLDDDHVLNFKM
jgi:phosphatidylserine synthase 2